MPHIEKKNYALYATRRKELIKKIKSAYPNNQNAKIVLFGAFEQERVPFKQESSFYYYSGIEEPAATIIIDLEQEMSSLYVPNFGTEREKWVAGVIQPTLEKAQLLGFDRISYAGNPCKGYQCHPFFTASEYAQIVQDLTNDIDQQRTIFTINPDHPYAYIEQRFILQRLTQFIPNFLLQCVDVSPLIAQMRRKKNNHEIELIYKAIDITVHAHQAAARVIQEGAIEYEIQAAIEYIFTSSGATIAFPSIVGSGKNSTVLHYNQNNAIIGKNDLVVVDIGASYNYYCADLTRTYPVAKTFTKRQREIYSIVLDTQDYIANLAKPGIWLSNKNKPEESLYHLAHDYLKSKGYDKYFMHGIGHFLGLDVHDVGDYQEPLQVGDVITIEPGIYIPQESLGVRIEDNYWIVPDGCVSLSENLSKAMDDIEQMMQPPVEMDQEFEKEDDEGFEA